MGGFLYAVCGEVKKPDLVGLRALGLGHAFERPGFDWTPVTGGPWGAGKGCLLRHMAHREEGVLRHDAAEQVWRRLPEALCGGASVWVGHAVGSVPVAADVAREQFVEGTPVMLGDGGWWVCPQARRVEYAGPGEVTARCLLPCRAGLDERTGLWVSSAIDPQYAELWALAERWWEEVVAGAEPLGEQVVVRLDFDLRMEFASRALGVNYRVGPMECVMLGLLNELQAVEVLNVACGFADWNRLIKKKARIPCT